MARGASGERLSREAPPLVLLVDDDEALLDSVGKGLRREGFKVVTAVSGADALRIVQELREPVDVAVVDIFLPDSWGSSLAFTLKQSFPGVVLIYISGYADTDPILRDFDDPDVVLLSKPFELEALVTSIRSRLSNGGGIKG